jgi:hypothetical protein
MYPSEKSMAKAQVKGFMDYVVANQADIAKASQVVPMTSAQLSKARSELKEAEANAGS